jgi:hypothetical protein
MGCNACIQTVLWSYTFYRFCSIWFSHLLKLVGFVGNATLGQVARSGGGIVFKGLYSGLSGNLAGVLPSVPSRTLSLAAYSVCALLPP